MERKEIEAVAVQREKRQSGLEGRGREEQPPGRVLFTLEELKPLRRGKLRTGWKERRGNGTRGERDAREGKPAGELRRETGPGQARGPGRERGGDPSGARSGAREARGRWRAARRVWEAAPG